MGTTVINIQKAPAGWQSDPQYVYIGRQGHGHSGYFGNPRWTGGKIDGDCSFESYARALIATDAEFKRRVTGLYGKTLVCFCKPNDCHGDMLVILAHELNSEQEQCA